jgi:hypothetical protein
MLNAGKLYPHGIQFGGKQRPTEPLPTNMMQLHYLTESQAFPYASIKLPHSGYDYVVAPHELYTKTYAPDLGGQITRDSGVSKADVKIIKQAVYTAGRAAAEELMKKKKA